MPAISKITPDVLEKIRTMAAEGKNASQIGKVLEINNKTVAKACRDNNIDVLIKTDAEKQRKREVFIEELKRTRCIKTAAEIANLGSSGQHIIDSTPGLRDYVTGRGISKRLSPEEIQSRIPVGGGTFTGNYINSKWEIQAEDGYLYYKDTEHLHQGDPRGKCGTPIPLEEIIKKLDKLEYEYIGGYSNINSSMTIKHKKCGNTRKTRFRLVNIQECPTCGNIGTSKSEKEILKWVESLGVEAVPYLFKGKTKGKQIDIYIPSKKIGIEYNGLYWHTDKYKPDKNYHKNKTLQANDNGIRLITVFEDEYLHRPNQVRGLIKSILGISDRVISSQDCSLKAITREEADSFLLENAIENHSNSAIRIGLYLNQELLGLLSGNKVSSHEFEIEKFVIKSGVCIPKGGVMLMDELKEYCKAKKYTCITSISDNRWSQGDEFKDLGFYKIEEIDPEFFYCTKPGKREMDSKGKVLNHPRIWDCGKIRWKYSL